MSDGRADIKEEQPSSRDRLLDAALSVISEKGFAASATREIAARAGVNEVTLFRLFNTKSRLFDAVVSERFPRSQLVRGLHFERSEGMERNLVDNSVELLRILGSNRDYVRLITFDLPRASYRDRSDPFRPAFVGPLIGYLAVCEDQGLITENTDVDAVADILYGMLHDRFIRVASVDNAQDLIADRRYLETVIQVILNGLRDNSKATPSELKPKGR